MDKFEEMLRLQKEFQDKYGFTKVGLDKIAMAMAAESGELWDASDGKWWKKTKDTPEHRLEELVDLWHFFMAYMLEAKISPTQFFEAYKAKLAINYQRQESKTY
jgi:dimeric dUTPase (all-alpha-NTP-PPase superfamily)